MIPLILPLFALNTALALLLLTTLSVPYSLLSVLSANLGIALLFIISFKPYLKEHITIFEQKLYSGKALGILGWLALGVICTAILYALVHSLLPTLHYDSVTNWNMRSKVSYHRAELIFSDVDGLIKKPYYPVLYHALQISVMQLFPYWIDTVANLIHLLLSTSLFYTTYRLLRERNYRIAVITLSLILGLPLLLLHTGQGYADLPLIGYSCVSLLFLARFIDSQKSFDLLLSGAMVAACVWTKSEGLFFCFAPWVATVLVIYCKQMSSLRTMLYPLLWATSISLLWPMYILLHGYTLTPHGSSDIALRLNVSALTSQLSALFIGGSFGMYWYALLIVGVIASISYAQGTLRTRYSPTLLWGLLSFIGYVGVYLFTSNAEYLLLGQSFDRQMLLPAALLTISISLLLSEKDSVVLR